MIIPPQFECTECHEHADFVSSEHEKTFCGVVCFKQFIKRIEDGAYGEEPPAILFNTEVPQMLGAVHPTSIGPRSNLPYTLPIPLRKFIIKCTKYMASLSLFEQYLVWRYTAGSASVNGFLIFNKVTNMTNATYWCYQLFLYWKNTVKGVYGKIHTSLLIFTKYFENPAAFLALSTAENASIVPDILRRYALELQKIISASPPVKGDGGFHVFKVAGDYPGLPQSPTDVPKMVAQLPFNSTTINPHFNFAFFIPDEAKGNVFDIHIPVGARVLYVPGEFHAYPFEKEILLPFGCQFKITEVYTGKLDYIDKKSHNIVTLQTPPNSIMMGPVYELNDYEPCVGGSCLIKRKNFKTFLTEYVAP